MADRLPRGKFITCILPKGEGHRILKKLCLEKGIASAAVQSARGVSTATGLLGRHVDIRVEKDVLSVMIDGDRADEVFAYLYEEAGVGERFGSMIYQGAVGPALPLTLPPGPIEE